ncbi:hypothetical protein BH11BAC3_BH11BAC3_03640 [soil metagenome]
MMEILLSMIVMITLFVKVGIHIHLDKIHERFTGFAPSSMQPIKYFFFYIEKVRKDFETEKKICNISYLVLIISIILAFIVRFFS